MEYSESIAIAAGAAVVIVALLTGHDGAAIAAFFGFIGGLGFGRTQKSLKPST